MKKKKDYFTEIYNQYKPTGAYIIEVGLRKYTDVFNEWDPAPFKRRDLDPDLVQFLEECSSEIPMKFPLLLLFHLPEEKHSSDSEEWIITGVNSFFNHTKDLMLKKIKQANRRILFDTLLGFLFLFLAIILEKIFQVHFLLKILLEGVFIGGWVFLWEAFYCFFFENRGLYSNLKQYKRFSRATIHFKYD